MKDFASARSESASAPVEADLQVGRSTLQVGRSSMQIRAVYGVAAAWLLIHLPFLAPALEDIDSINFALGLHHYDPSLHQPHPPGYPVFIAAGRFALGIIHAVAPGLS